MIVPTMAPPIAPDTETDRAAYPSAAVSTLTRIAAGRAATIPVWATASDSAWIRLATQRTAPAVAGTERLSSRRTGRVSTAAAAIAAAIGATIAKTSGGIGVTAGRTHHASATAAMLPQTMNAPVPAIVLSGFQGSAPRLTAER